MPIDLFRRDIDLGLIYPPFLEKWLDVLAKCQARGKRYLCTQGFRTFGESMQLAAAALKGGPRAAPAGLSAHNYGLAFDTALIIQESPKRVVRWDVKDFDILIEEARAAGLDCGVDYNDTDHFGWGGFSSGKELLPLADLWRTNTQLPLPERLRLVWDYVDTHGPEFTHEPVAR